MNVRSRPIEAPARRVLAVFAAAAVMLTLLPASAQGQQANFDPREGCPVPPPESDFADRNEIPEAHLANVDCAAFFEIVQGFTDNTYRPAASVRRDQMSSFIARSLTAAGVQLPPASEGPTFDDVPADSVHRQNIRRLAAADIVLGGPAGLSSDQYGPSMETRRDQMVSFIVRAAEFAFDAEFSSSTQQFDDVPEGNVHFENVNYAAQNQIVLGFDENTFGPALSTRRDQMAAFTVRLLNFLSVPADVEITEQSAEQATVGEQITVTASVFTQYREAAQQTGGDASFTAGEDVTFQAQHSQDPGVVAPQEQTVESDDSGEAQFTFTSPQTGTVTVTASIPGPGGAFAAADGDSHTVQKEFVLEAPDVNGDTGTIAGAITDQGGDPITGAIVSFQNTTPSATVSDTDGNYESLPLQPDTYTVEVTGVEGVVNFDCQPTTQEVTLDPGESVTGVDFTCSSALADLGDL